jgi:hypothetical protein
MNISPRDANVLAFLQPRISQKNLIGVACLLSGRNIDILKHLPHKYAKDEAPAPVKDDISDALVKLMQFLKGAMRNEDYKQAELLVSEIMGKNRDKNAEHERALNEASAANPAPAQDTALTGFRKRLHAGNEVAKFRFQERFTPPVDGDASQRLRQLMARIRIE